MSSKESEREFVKEIFGSDQGAKNLARKAGASIYHSLMLHPMGLDDELWEGILKTLDKVISKEDRAKVLAAHDQHHPHKL